MTSAVAGALHSSCRTSQCCSTRATAKPARLHVRSRVRRIVAMGFTAGGGQSRSGGDPFSAKPSTVTPQKMEVGFLRDGARREDMMATADADRILSQFDTDCKAAVERNQAGLGFVSPQKEAELQAKHPEMRAACETLASESVNVMMGICAPSAAEGVTTLKAWVGGMGLTRGMLHGMDRNGVAVPISGAVFIKYNSKSGDADLSGYAGSFRGVLFTPTLLDGDFRQYGYLPLSTFTEDPK